MPAKSESDRYTSGFPWRGRRPLDEITGSASMAGILLRARATSGSLPNPAGLSTHLAQKKPPDGVARALGTRSVGRRPGVRSALSASTPRNTGPPRWLASSKLRSRPRRSVGSGGNRRNCGLPKPTSNTGRSHNAGARSFRHLASRNPHDHRVGPDQGQFIPH